MQEVYQFILRNQYLKEYYVEDEDLDLKEYVRYEKQDVKFMTDERACEECEH